MPSRGYRAKVAATGGNAITVESLYMGASGRGWVRSVEANVSSGTPADLESLLYLDRITASGTATALGSSNIAPDDMADAGHEEGKVHVEHSVAPTYASRPFYEAYFNHRVKERIVLAQDQYWSLATAQGIGVRITSTGTPVTRSMISWAE